MYVPWPLVNTIFHCFILSGMPCVQAKTSLAIVILNNSSSTKPEIKTSYTFSAVNRWIMTRDEDQPSFSWIILKWCVRIYSWLRIRLRLAWHSSRSDTRETIPSRTSSRWVDWYMDVLWSWLMYWQAALGNISTEGDIEGIKTFFEVCPSHISHSPVYWRRTQHKDTSRYQLTLAQTLDSLRASAAWIEVGFQLVMLAWASTEICAFSVLQRTSLSGSANAITSYRYNSLLVEKLYRDARYLLLFGHDPICNIAGVWFVLDVELSASALATTTATISFSF